MTSTEIVGWLFFVSLASFIAGAMMMVASIKNEVRSGVVTFSGEAWITTKTLPQDVPVGIPAQHDD